MKRFLLGGEFVGDQGQFVEEWLPPTAYAVSQITDDARTSPVFRPFEDTTLHTTNLVESIGRALHSQLLADAIPAESLPVGSSVVPRWSVSLDIHGDDGGARVVQNKNMAVDFKDSANMNILGNESKQAWGHSFFLSAPYMVVHGLFEDIKSNMRGDL